MNWSKIQTPPHMQIFKMHSFTCVSAGTTYSLEVDEFPGSRFVGHGEQANDKNNVLGSVSATNLEDCVNLLLKAVSQHK